MIELLQFYSLAFVVVAVAAVALNMVGEHTLPRGSSLEIFTLAQFALMGHLLANIWTEHSGLCLLTSGVFYFLGKFIISKFSNKIHVTDPLMISFYLIVLSLQYFLITYFPGLDGHMTVGVFGSVVTSGFYENILMITIFITGIIIFLIKRKEFLKHTIEQSLLGANCYHFIQELFISLVLICSLFGLGVLFTLSYVLIPWVFIGKSFKNQKRALICICLISMVTSISGLTISIAFSNISTTPSQVILLMFVCLLYYLKTESIDSFIKSK
jgi:zinc transport system permease protein